MIIPVRKDQLVLLMRVRGMHDHLGKIRVSDLKSSKKQILHAQITH